MITINDLDTKSLSRFATAYRNGCSSGLVDSEEAIGVLKTLPDEKQDALIKEYNNLLKIIDPSDGLKIL